MLPKTLQVIQNFNTTVRGSVNSQKLFYAIIPTLFPCFLLICNP